MKIKMLDATRILVVLNTGELAEYNVSFAELSLNEQHSRRLLQDMIQQAGSSTGTDLTHSPLQIEALQYEHGCLFLLTRKAQKHRRKIYRLLARSNTFIYLFDSTDAFLSCIAALYRSRCIPPLSAAYAIGERYCLILKTAVPLKKGMNGILSEYAAFCRCGSIYASFVREHGTAVQPSAAVETIGQALCR